MTDQHDSGDHRSGEWLGSIEGLKVRDPGPDADGPIVDIHGEEGMAAVEIASERFVDELSIAAAEVQMSIDEHRTEDDDDV